jgi:hypothetical protein
MTGGASARTGGAGATGGTTQTATPSGGVSATGGSSPGTGGSSASACPTSSDYVGSQSWLGKVQVTERAEYCGTSVENRTLEQELAAKAKLRIAAGTYPLPDQNGTYPFAWPVCFEFPPGNEAPKFAGAGQILLKRTAYSTEEFISYRESQPLSSSQSKSLTFIGDVSNFTTPGVSPPPVVLDGSPLFELSRNYTFMICQDKDCTGKWNDLWFYSCGSDKDRLMRDTLTFSGGQLVLELRIGKSNAGTEPSSFVLASGTLDGTTFTQTDYWKLVYRPDHHHYRRHYAVIFSNPIAGACGLKAEMVGDTAAVTVHTMGCDLANIAARAVTSSTTERP